MARLAIIFDYIGETMGAGTDRIVHNKTKHETFLIIALAGRDAIAPQDVEKIQTAILHAGGIEHTKLYICGHGTINNTTQVFADAEGTAAPTDYPTVARHVYQAFSLHHAIPSIGLIICYAARSTAHHANHDTTGTFIGKHWHRIDIQTSLLYRLSRAIFLSFSPRVNIHVNGRMGAVTLDEGHACSSLETMEHTDHELDSGRYFRAHQATLGQEALITAIRYYVAAISIGGQYVQNIEQSIKASDVRRTLVRDRNTLQTQCREMFEAPDLSDLLIDSITYNIVKQNLRGEPGFPKYNKIVISNSGQHQLNCYLRIPMTRRTLFREPSKYKLLSVERL